LYVFSVTQPGSAEKEGELEGEVLGLATPPAVPVLEAEREPVGLRLLLKEPVAEALLLLEGLLEGVPRMLPVPEREPLLLPVTEGVPGGLPVLLGDTERVGDPEAVTVGLRLLDPEKEPVLPFPPAAHPLPPVVTMLG
jgi:hypothetical protein